MGIMDQMKDKVIGAAASKVMSSMGVGDSPIVRAVTQLVMNSGGVGGLVQRFQSQGLGDVAESWVGKGANQPLQEDQVQRVFGGEQLQSVAQANGMSVQDLTSQLTRALPSIVDKLTPEGKAPAQEQGPESILSAGFEMVKKGFH